ncbi:MAG: hypothetical protein QJR02_00145 [Sinobacteraceae bacterium]|nr:hypothetical protein [Nevskiaceae bacterium]
MKSAALEVADLGCGLDALADAVAKSIQSGWCLYFAMTKTLHVVVEGHHVCENNFYIKFAKVLSALDQAANQLAFSCGVHYLEKDCVVVPLIPVEAIRPGALTTERDEEEVLRDIGKLKGALSDEIRAMTENASRDPPTAATDDAVTGNPDRQTPQGLHEHGDQTDPPPRTGGADADASADQRSESETLSSRSMPQVFQEAIGTLVRRMSQHSDACVWLPDGNPAKPVVLPKVAAAVKPEKQDKTITLSGEVSCRIGENTVVIEGQHIVNEEPVGGGEVRHLQVGQHVKIEVVRVNDHDWTVNQIVASPQMELF